MRKVKYIMATTRLGWTSPHYELEMSRGPGKGTPSSCFLLNLTQGARWFAFGPYTGLRRYLKLCVDGRSFSICPTFWVHYVSVGIENRTQDAFNLYSIHYFLEGGEYV